MLPLTSEISSKQVQFTLLEINSESILILKKVLKKLQLEDYVAAIENCDALNYTIKSPDQFDIMVTETMQAGLRKEPQVAISHKLMGQLGDEAVMIPEEVALNLYLVNNDLRMDYKLSKASKTSCYQDLGPVFVLNNETIAANRELFWSEFPEVEFPEVEIELPKGAQRKFDFVMLNTNIKIYKEHILDTDQSGLTVLLVLAPLSGSMIHHKRIRAQYISDLQPGLDCSFID